MSAAARACTPVPAWPLAGAPPGEHALLKARPEDFRVHEISAVVATGEGEHLLLEIEKRGLGTRELASRLADAYGVRDVDVGYAGMKDRHAVTTQWFSVRTARDAGPAAAVDGARVLTRARHRRKLRRGDLSGNRFRIVLRDVSGGGWEPRLEVVREHGVPNYFGPQRFGRDNLNAARAWLRRRRRRRRASAFREGLYRSVLRSFLFNEVLAARVRAGSWETLIEGDVPAADDDRAPTGPLWGRGRTPVAGAALAVEEAALAPHREILDSLEHTGLEQQRRSLVLRPKGLSWEARGDAVELTFTLGPGCYATTLLAEAFRLDEGARDT